MKNTKDTTFCRITERSKRRFNKLYRGKGIQQAAADRYINTCSHHNTILLILYHLRFKKNILSR